MNMKLLICMATCSLTLAGVAAGQGTDDAQIESRLTDAFAFVFAKSTMTITDVQTKLLAPNIALAHVSWTMTGSRTPPIIPEPRQGIEIQVLKRMGGRWLIYSFQNTNSVPERPFPKGPPGPIQRIPR